MSYSCIRALILDSVSCYIIFKYSYCPLIGHEEDDLLGWASNKHRYLCGSFEAVREVIPECGPSAELSVNEKGWLYSAANELQTLFYNTWSADSFKQFNENETVSNTFMTGNTSGSSAIFSRGAPYPSNMRPPPSCLGPAVFNQ